MMPRLTYVFFVLVMISGCGDSGEPGNSDDVSGELRSNGNPVEIQSMDARFQSTDSGSKRLTIALSTPQDDSIADDELSYVFTFDIADEGWESDRTFVIHGTAAQQDEESPIEFTPADDSSPLITSAYAHYLCFCFIGNDVEQSLSGTLSLDEVTDTGAEGTLELTVEGPFLNGGQRDADDTHTLSVTFNAENDPR